MSALPATTGQARGSLAPSSLALFRLDGRRFGIDASAVVEILAAVATSPLPCRPDYIAGIIDLRGTLVPVIDLRVRFGLPARLMELTDHLIVTRSRNRLVALWVDEVESLGRFEATGWSQAGGLVAGDRSLAGVLTTADGIATIHDVAAFVAQCEADAVFEAAAR